MKQREFITRIESNYPKPVIAVSPGTRYLGFALFDGSRLLDWGTKAIRPGDYDEKSSHAAAVMTAIIEGSAPQILVLRKPDERCASLVLGRLATELTDLARERGLRVYSFNLGFMKQILGREERTTKRELIENAVAEYPFLRHELEAEQASHEAYHDRMFDAVILGMATRRFLRL